MRKLAWLVAALALCAQAEDVYKWTDDKGQVHYGEQPPLDANTTTLKVPPPGSAPADAPPAADKPKVAADKGMDSGKMPTDKAKRCDLEKEQLAVLQKDGPVRYWNDKKELVELDPAKRAASITLVQENIKRYCS